MILFLFMVLQKEVTANSYIKVLDEGLLEFIEEMGVKKRFPFMLDKASIHKVHIVQG